MKMKLETSRNKLYFKIKYSKWEWQKLDDILSKRLGLQKKNVTNGWGNMESLEAYITADESLKDYLLKSINKTNIFDNLNKPLVSINHDIFINIAFFRVVPDMNHEVRIKLDKYLTISELKELIDTAKYVYGFIFDIAPDAEININIKEKE